MPADPGGWYWCLTHRRPEPEGEQCRGSDRMGPYASAEEARRWQDKVEDRNETWDEEDRRWEGEAEDA